MSDPCDTRVLLLKGLGNPYRALIFGLLLIKEHSVNELAERLQAFAPTISQHLDEMKLGGLVVCRGDRNRRVYRLRFLKASRKLAAAIEAFNALAFPDGPKTIDERIAAFLERRDDDRDRKRKAS